MQSKGFILYPLFKESISEIGIFYKNILYNSAYFTENEE